MKRLPYTLEVKFKDFSPDSLDNITKKPYCFFLDSAGRGRIDGRYTFFGIDPVRTFSSSGGFITVDNRTFIDSPVDALRRFELSLQDLPFDPYLPFHGGMVGFLGHTWPGGSVSEKDNFLAVPDAWFGLYDTVCIFDHLEKSCMVSSMGITPDGKTDNDIAKSRCEELASLLELNPKEDKISYVIKPLIPDPVSSFDEGTYVHTINAARENLFRDEWKRINVAQRFHAPIAISPWTIHKMLRANNPTSYSSFLRCGNFEIMSASPSGFLKINDRELQCNVVQKSIMRNVDPEKDEKNRTELLQNAGTIDPVVMGEELSLETITRERPAIADPIIESDSRAHYLTNKITGTRKSSATITDCLKAAMPGASMTGVPKIPVNKWLREMEPSLRHAYTGVIGYIGTGKNAKFSLAVRTMMVKDSVAFVHSGTQVSYSTNAEETFYNSRDHIDRLFEEIKSLGKSEE